MPETFRLADAPFPNPFIFPFGKCGWDSVERDYELSLDNANRHTSMMISEAHELQTLILLSRREAIGEEILSGVVRSAFVTLAVHKRMLRTFVDDFRRVHDKPVAFGDFNSLSYHELAGDVAADLYRVAALSPPGTDLPLGRERPEFVARTWQDRLPFILERAQGFNMDRLHLCLEFEFGRAQKRAEAKSIKTKGSANPERDAYVVKRKRESATLNEIMVEVNANPDWTPLKTRQAVQQVLKRMGKNT